MDKTDTVGEGIEAQLQTAKADIEQLKSQLNTLRSNTDENLAQQIQVDKDTEGNSMGMRLYAGRCYGPHTPY